MFFELLNFIKRRARRDQENYQIPSQTTLNFKQNFKNAPNLIGLHSSKIYMSKRRQETQKLSPEEQYKLAANKKFQRTKKDSSKNCNKTQSNELKKTNQNQAKIEAQSKTQRQERVNEKRLYVLIKQNNQESLGRDLGTRTRNASTKNKICLISQFSTKREKRPITTTNLIQRL